MKKLKVCHFTSAHKADDIRIFHKECISLAEAGHEVYLVAANTDQRVMNGVHLVNVISKNRGRIGRMIFTGRAVYQKAKSLNCDVYHFHDPELLRFALRLKRKGKIVIYDAHEDLPRQILGKEYLRFKSTVARIVEIYENRIARRVSFVITATPFIAERFKQINKNCVDINNFPLLNEIDFEKSDLERDVNKACFIGAISNARGINELVESLNETNVRLDLAGTIPESMKSNLIAMKGWTNVNELGLVNREQSLKIKSSSSAGIVTFLPLPNHINAQPNKIFEYMASGLPVVGSNFPLWKEIIEDNNCGVCVDPTNPSDIIKGILYILNNPELAQQMGVNGRRLVINKYNWDIEKKKLIEIYSQFSI